MKGDGWRHGTIEASSYKRFDYMMHSVLFCFTTLHDHVGMCNLSIFSIMVFYILSFNGKQKYFSSRKYLRSIWVPLHRNT